ncbi:polyamine-modulated factor 1 [Notolabrus celidotus]|uniref:polyamine-modulated factor 1 n=1 Tax=Notolabrus celidotus TaxID=1203425 RepID=UPI0014904FB6|nr:polyamine-modulated factor 1 [Notolabrus celidotus]
MEESEIATRKETVHNVGLKDSSENQTKDATEEVSSQMSNSGSSCKPSEEPEAKFNRLKLFDKVMQKSLERFIQYVSFNRFASTFRPLYQKNPQRMESIHKQFIEELQGAIKEDISRLIEEGNLEFKLNELDELEKAAKNNPDPAWRPSGIPEQDFCSFLVPYYQKQEAYMRLELKKIRAENAALAQKVQAGRESVAQTEHQICTAVEEWKAWVTKFEKLASSLCPADVFDV